SSNRDGRYRRKLAANTSCTTRSKHRVPRRLLFPNQHRRAPCFYAFCLTFPGYVRPFLPLRWSRTVYFRISRIPLARFFLKRQKISNHEWIRINTNFSYCSLLALNFFMFQFVVKPSVGLEPPLLISDSKSV